MARRQHKQRTTRLWIMPLTTQTAKLLATKMEVSCMWSFLVLKAEYFQLKYQYGGCWCSGSWRHRVINSQGIKYARLAAGPCLRGRKISTTRTISMLRHERKCKKYMYYTRHSVRMAWSYTYRGLIPCAKCFIWKTLRQSLTCKCVPIAIDIYLNIYWSQASNIRHAFVGNKIVDHSDVVGASSVGGIWCDLY